MKFYIVSATLALFVISAQGAVPKKTNVSTLTEKKKLSQDIEAALTALQLPIDNRVNAVSQQKNGFQSLRSIVNNSDQPLTVRWRAMTALGRAFPKKSLKFLVGMSKSSEWYHRNSSLIALKAASPKLAIKTAERLLKDPSLVVRTAAVQTIIDLESKTSRNHLWKSLNAEKNFRKGQSLWIRQHIMKALAQAPDQREQLRFAKYLNDKDPKVQLWAIDGLEKITGLKKEFHGLSFNVRRKKWLAWASENKLQTQM